MPTFYDLEVFVLQIKESGENYLETILILTLRNGSVRSIDIVNELEYTKPSVGIAIKNKCSKNDMIPGEPKIVWNHIGI